MLVISSLSFLWTLMAVTAVKIPSALYLYIGIFNLHPFSSQSSRP